MPIHSKQHLGNRDLLWQGESENLQSAYAPYTASGEIWAPSVGFVDEDSLLVPPIPHEGC